MKISKLPFKNNIERGLQDNMLSSQTDYNKCLIQEHQSNMDGFVALCNLAANLPEDERQVAFGDLFMEFFEHDPENGK